MSDTAIFVIGSGVFGLLVVGLMMTAREFLRASDRPDIPKGSNLHALRHVDRTEP